nr:hypothetical protein [Tanacetum cinerariifolium]
MVEGWKDGRTYNLPTSCEVATLILSISGFMPNEIPHLPQRFTCADYELSKKPHLPVQCFVLKIGGNGPGSGHFGACLVLRDERSLYVSVSGGYYDNFTYKFCCTVGPVGWDESTT